MPDEIKLETLRVRDLIQYLPIAPDALSPDCSIELLLRKMIENPATRHVYIVDADRRLLGAVRMNTVVAYLFPFAGLRAHSSEWVLSALPRFRDVTLHDLMNDQPRFVHEDTTLSEMAEMLMEEKINELPVVDQNRKLIGQVNIYNVIATYLQEKEHATARDNSGRAK